MWRRLDCVILDLGDTAAWYSQDEGVYSRGRLYLHRLHEPVPDCDHVQVLADMATHLQRFDVCMLTISECNLAWMRRVLLAAQPHMCTPLMGLLHNLKAPAIGDLYNLGMADFVQDPFCLEEIRIRAQRLAQYPRLPSGRRHTGVASGQSAVHDRGKDYGSDDLCIEHMIRHVATGTSPGRLVALSDPDLLQQTSDIALEAFAVASASYCVTSDESFGTAKGRVVGCFERAYLRASLAKSSGNIALAARGAKKHRRAYWALLRKHNIDAAAYRKVMPSNQ